MFYIRADNKCLFYRDASKYCKEQNCDGYNCACQMYCAGSYLDEADNSFLKDFFGEKAITKCLGLAK